MMNFEFTGSVQSVTLAPGQYVLECWGAQGGSYNSFYGGKGGYSKGILSLSTQTKLYVYVGGQPATVNTDRVVVPGGFNGGGNGYNRYYSGVYTYGQGGGGASDIRIGQDSLYARIIVAGGGGGAANANNETTKCGGGTNGSSPISSYGATQTGAGTNGSFGVGGSATTSGSNYRYGSGGGGGGWYGGGACSSYSDSTAYYDYNGGGSGFILQGSNAPSGYLLDSKYYLTEAQTIDGSKSFTAPTGGNETGHAGNGYVRITPVKPNPPTNLNETHDYFSVSLSWTGVSGVSGYKVYLNGTLKATTSATSSMIAGLDAASDYMIRIIAYDATGESDPVEIAFTTPSANLMQTAKEYQSITIAWDSTARASGYRVYRDGTLIATITSTEYTDKGLLPSKSYNYTVKAYSGAVTGNLGVIAGTTEEAYYEQKVVFETIKIVPNPTTINTKVTLTVTAEDKLVIYEPEKFYSGEIYSGEI